MLSFLISLIIISIIVMLIPVTYFFFKTTVKTMYVDMFNDIRDSIPKNDKDSK